MRLLNDSFKREYGKTTVNINSWIGHNLRTKEKFHKMFAKTWNNESKK